MMPHTAMATLFGAAFLYAIVALSWASARSGATSANPWHEERCRLAVGRRSAMPASCAIWTAAASAAFNEDDRPTDRRKIYHHLTFLRFCAVFCRDVVATLYHYFLAREARYPCVGSAPSWLARSRHGF